MLTRLARLKPGALAEVAAKAFEVMHFKRPDNGLWDAQTSRKILAQMGNLIAKRVVSTALLSYYNQPDQTVIGSQGCS